MAARARHALRRTANSPVVAALEAQAVGFLQRDDAQPSQLELCIPDAFQVHYLALSVIHVSLLSALISSRVFFSSPWPKLVRRRTVLTVDGVVRVSGC